MGGENFNLPMKDEEIRRFCWGLLKRKEDRRVGIESSLAKKGWYGEFLYVTVITAKGLVMGGFHVNNDNGQKVERRKIETRDFEETFNEK